MWTEAIALLAGLGLGYAIRSFRLYLGRQASTRGNRTVLYGLADALASFYQKHAQPADLIRNEGFREGVRLLNSGGFSTEDLLGYYRGDNESIACMALEALAKRPGGTELVAPVLGHVNDVGPWIRYFVFRFLRRHGNEPVVARLLEIADASWQNPMARELLRQFVVDRLEAGETVDVESLSADMAAEKVDWLEEFLRTCGSEQAAELATRLQQQHRSQIDVGLLRTIGRLWGERDTDVLEHAELVEDVDGIERIITAGNPRSVLLVGESGVGKTARLRLLARRLIAGGWTVFEASASELIAGQIYVGQLEGRIRELLAAIRVGSRVLWIVPDMHLFVVAGRGEHHRISVLDILAPHLVSGEVLLVGEIQPPGLERLLQAKPELRTAMEAISIAPLADPATRALAQSWAQRHALPDGAPVIRAATIAEAQQLAKQLLSDTASPGNLLQLLELARQASCPPGGEGRELTLEDLYGTLSRITGLPRSILDDATQLDLDRLRGLFLKHVLGQPEAVDCLVERVAMIKAGLTDPGRPQGVFLFTGPTGTGKTKIARTLAEFLFGSPDRMIRLDMSEFHAGSLHRLLGDMTETGEKTALVNQIRKQPFSVVLLDEIEKADSSVWDLFLQVFDAGRMTDAHGRIADFRHAIFILTSNLGSEAFAGPSLGFTSERAQRDRAIVEKALKQNFRPEFLNRLDRVVVFRSLSRSTMRAILLNELDRVLELRGLRNRQWAVEWDESALDFLLQQGFTETLGARPLRRAVERYVLSPLAMTIVNREAPAGDQFLFVRSDGNRLDVAFIDPDAPETTTPEPVLRSRSFEDTLSIGQLILDGSGSPREVDFLTALHQELSSVLSDAPWEDLRQQALTATSTPEFWTSASRFAVLGRFEQMERVEAGWKTATRLLHRLCAGERRARYPTELVRRLGQQLYLLQAAIAGIIDDRPQDAYLSVEALHDPREDPARVETFASRIAAMYRQWARKRRMALEELDPPASDGTSPRRTVFSVSGYGAFTILEPETGLHVFDEGTDASRARRRARVRVTVAPQPAEPAGSAGLLAQALPALRAMQKGEPKVVRNYREQPSPLVRDRVRRWRSGRIDRVLAGDFDLVGEPLVPGASTG